MKMIEKSLAVFFMSFLLAGNGKHFQEFMELQVLSMIGSRSVRKLAYLKECGKLVCLIMEMKRYRLGVACN